MKQQGMRTVRRMLLAGFLAITSGLSAGVTPVSTQFIQWPDSVPVYNDAGQVVSRLPVGTAVERMGDEMVSGRIRIRIPKGKEGWIESRYLADEPAPSIESLRKQLADLEQEKNQWAQMQEELAALRAENARLADLHQGILVENRDLQQSLSSHPLWFLTRPESRHIFGIGALVLLTGLVIGMWLSRGPRQRQNLWNFR